MGVEPEDEFIPIDLFELSDNIQFAVILFRILPDKIAEMSGAWLGKDFSGLLDIMNLYGVEDQRKVFDLLMVCISEAEKFYSKKNDITEEDIEDING